jgi:hypothetical protein
MPLLRIYGRATGKGATPRGPGARPATASTPDAADGDASARKKRRTVATEEEEDKPPAAGPAPAAAPAAAQTAPAAPEAPSSSRKARAQGRPSAGGGDVTSPGVGDLPGKVRARAPAGGGLLVRWQWRSAAQQRRQGCSARAPPG